jgi:hypothetical protein
MNEVQFLGKVWGSTSDDGRNLLVAEIDLEGDALAKWKGLPSDVPVVITISPGQLLNYMNFGRKSLDDTMEVLGEIGLALGMKAMIDLYRHRLVGS